jgi:hypothetical protein
MKTDKKEIYKRRAKSSDSLEAQIERFNKAEGEVLCTDTN